jgi:hypothetical protein
MGKKSYQWLHLFLHWTGMGHELIKPHTLCDKKEQYPLQ